MLQIIALSADVPFLDIVHEKVIGKQLWGVFLNSGIEVFTMSVLREACFKNRCAFCRE